MVRLNKYLANAGIVSRRKVKDLLTKGLVTVNGQNIVEPGIRIDPEKDIITVNGQELKKSSDLVYIILNKPLNVVSTTSDEHGRPTVTSMVKSKVKLYPVGRLDSDSIGLILLTNDGELTHKLTHPKFHIPKRYQVLVKGKVTANQLDQFRNGVVLSDGLTLPAEVNIIKEYKFTTKLEVILSEGRNRQIRRMCAKLGLEVLELKRVSIGPLALDNIPEGLYRDLTDEEIFKLKEAAGL